MSLPRNARRRKGDSHTATYTLEKGLMRHETSDYRAIGRSRIRGRASHGGSYPRERGEASATNANIDRNHGHCHIGRIHG
jgi:hypothetical protein